MSNTRKLVDVADAKAFVMANWPNDPLLRQIGLHLLDELPEAVPMDRTHGDRIRAATDMELARMLIQAGDIDGPIDFCQCRPECLALLDSGNITDEMCAECALQWLASPVDAEA